VTGPEERFGLGLGDCGLSGQGFPAGVDRMLSEVQRGLRPGGEAIIRVFIRPDDLPTDDDLISFVYGLKGHAIDALRWRYAIHAAHISGGENIKAAAAWDAFAAAFPDHAPLLQKNGWSAEDFKRVALYRGSQMHLNFPSAETLAARAQSLFQQVSFAPSGDYPMAELCPFLILRP